MDKRVLAYGLLAAFAVFAYYFAFNAEEIGEWCMNEGNFLAAWLVYILTQPTYLLIIGGVVFFNKQVSKVKSFISGLLVAEALDIVSLPHCVSRLGMPTDAMSFACSDTLIIRELTKAIGFGSAWFVYYVALPVIFLFLAIEFLGYTHFLARVKQQGIGG